MGGVVRACRARLSRTLASGLVPAVLLALPAGAELGAESLGRVETLPAPHAHWVFAADPLLARASLVDLDAGTFLGVVDSGYGLPTLLFPSARDEIYVPSTYYSRGTRGERTDVVTVVDRATLAAVDEVVIPPKRATSNVALAHSALSDDDRFLAVFNLTPATSLSIVDMQERRFAGEIATPGCGLVYAAGDRRFMQLCGDGSLLTVTLDDAGQEVRKQRGEPFFDPETDPLTEKAVRAGDVWLFVSFEGRVVEVDVSGETVDVTESWSLVSELDRQDDWRTGGVQHLAAHAASRRLYALMHRGGPDSHKEPGEEVWVYELDGRKRVQRIELVNPGISLFAVPVEFGRDWPWPFDGLSDWMLDHLAPALVGQIQVTQDAEPLLFTASRFFGSLGVYDARSGDFLRRVQGVGFSTDVLLAPWGGGR